MTESDKQAVLYLVGVIVLDLSRLHSAAVSLHELVSRLPSDPPIEEVTEDALPAPEPETPP